MMQDFQLYFLQDSQKYGSEQIVPLDKSDFMPIGDMRTESEIVAERLEKDLVAQGSFSASDIISHSVFSDEFTHLEPGLFEEQSKKAKFTNLK